MHHCLGKSKHLEQKQGLVSKAFYLPDPLDEGHEDLAGDQEAGNEGHVVRLTAVGDHLGKALDQVDLGLIENLVRERPLEEVSQLYDHLADLLRIVQEELIAEYQTEYPHYHLYRAYQLRVFVIRVFRELESEIKQVFDELEF